MIRNAGIALSLLPWLVLLGWLSAVAWFLCDDAFISFRYARNLLEGHGLVFNPGEYVEGYTNFLWILELAALWKVLGIPPEQAAPWLSVICTIGVLAALGTWLARLPALRHRWLVAWMAFGLLCSSATFAVWTSGGGLETRQFTLFIVVAVVCLSLWRTKRWGLVVASLSLALAAYTRPEGLLVGLVCIGWFAAQSRADATPPPPNRTGGGWRDWGCSLLYWRRLAWLAVPFLVLVAAHYLFRYAYYGEWLPNTYYAKHVRPWYESGFRYLWAAALETGLYLILPLAAVAARQRWRVHRDGIFALPLLLVGVHMAYVMRIGGDHFEYRPLDFYWPLLAFPAAVGIVHLGARLAAGRWRHRLPRIGARACAVAVFVPVLFYAGAIQGALLFEGDKMQDWVGYVPSYIELDGDNAEWLLAVPGMPMLVTVSNDLRRQAARQMVARPFAKHRKITETRSGRYKPYERMERGVIPSDALMAEGALGIRSYYLPDLKVIDIFGLTDAIVARNPSNRANHERVIAHDRRPPPGYLEERGVNITVRPAANNLLKALMLGHHAAQVGPALWMPFDSPDEEWVLDRFAGRNLHVRDVYYAGLSWEQAAPNFDYRSEDLGFVLALVRHPWRRSKVQAFARNCEPDEPLVWPWSNKGVDRPTPQRWTINETGLCRATAATHPKWARSIVDNLFLLEEVKRATPVIRADWDVYLVENGLIYAKYSCSPEDTESMFFLHVFPADKRDLPRGRQKYGFDNLDFWMEKYTKVGGRCTAVRRLPDYPIAEIRTGQFTDEGRLWEGTIAVAESNEEGLRP